MGELVDEVLDVLRSKAGQLPAEYLIAQVSPEYPLVVATRPLGDIVAPGTQPLVNPLAKPLLTVSDRYPVVPSLQQFGKAAVRVPLGTVDDFSQSYLPTVGVRPERDPNVPSPGSPREDRAPPPRLPTLAQRH